MNNQDKILAFGYATSILIGLVLVFLLPANLSPSIYSNYAFYLACSNFLSLVLFEWLRQIQLRFLQGSLRTERDQGSRLGVIVFYLTVLTSLIALTVFISGFEISGLVLALGLTQGLFEYRQSILRTNELALPYSIFIILRILLLISAVFLIFDENTSLGSALSITLLVFVACTLLQFIFAAKKLHEFHRSLSLFHNNSFLPSAGQIYYGFNSSFSSIASVGVTIIIRRILLLLPSPELQALAIFIFEISSRLFNFAFNGIILVAQQKIFQTKRLGSDISFQLWHSLAGVFIGCGGLALCMASLPILIPNIAPTPAPLNQIGALLFASIILFTFLSGVRHSYIKLMAQKNFTTGKNRNADLIIASLVTFALISTSFIEPDTITVGLILISVSGIQFFLVHILAVQGHRMSPFLFLPLPFSVILFLAAELRIRGCYIASLSLLFLIAIISLIIFVFCGDLLRKRATFD